MFRTPACRAVLLALSITAAAALPAQALPDIPPLPLPAPPAPDTGSEARAAILISQRVGEDIRYVAPVGGSVPVAWDCTDEHVGNSFTVACTPNDEANAPVAPKPWECSRAYVLVSYEGNFMDTVTGTVDCGGGRATASCSPQRNGVPQDSCEAHSGGPAPMPFVCSVKYGSAVGPVMTSEWSVLCRTY